MVKLENRLRNINKYENKHKVFTIYSFGMKKKTIYILHLFYLCVLFFGIVKNHEKLLAEKGEGL